MKPIAFIGMPGSGKSTVSKLVADALRYGCFDSDECVERKLELSISQIFEQFGETEFRAAETKVIAALCSKSDAVLSLGGGAVLLNERLISGSCTVVYLTRTIDNIYTALLEQAGARPLAKSKDDLIKTYDARRVIYERMTDITVDNNGSPERTAETIMEGLKKCGY
jgi:shikimate kinase